MPDPNLVVSLLSPEEAPLYMRIRHEVFVPDVNKILYFNNPEASEATLNTVVEGIKNDIINKGVIFLKCVDTTTGEMIAGARWRYIRPKDPNAKVRTQEEMDEDMKIPEMLYAESHPEVWNGLFNLFNTNKREYMGNRPHYKLDTLATHPKHHRRGAGSLLLDWGCKKADEAGVEAYLEASTMGAPLYARYGFEPIKDISLDLRRWGGDEEIPWTLMRRPAKAAAS